MRIQRWNDSEGNPIGWRHYCPGCHQMHAFNVEQPTRAYPEFNIAGGVTWKFGGNEAVPSFTPSMHILVGGWKRKCEDGTEKEIPKRTVCHYHLSGGMLQFLADCGHELKGQTVVLPEIPEHLLEPT